MKKGVLAFVVAAHLGALSPPKPVHGVPSVLTGHFSTYLGNATLSVRPPAGWGIGEIEKQGDVAHFYLFPKKGGVGCEVKVAPNCESSKEVERLRKTFASVRRLPSGFQAQVGKAYYACQHAGEFVIEMWLPSGASKEVRSALCQAVSIAPEVVSSGDEPLLKKEPFRWVLRHPKRDQIVTIDRSIDTFKEESEKGLFSLKGHTAEGFFYLAWDSDKTATTYAEKMQGDFPGTRFEAPREEKGWTFCRGNPYSVIAVEGDGFLFGFALKNTNSFFSFNMGDYVKRVKWSKQ